MNKLVFLCVLLLGMTTCSTSKNRVENKEVFIEDDFLSVCEISREIDLYNKKIVKVKASISGFHEIVLSDAQCLNEENLLFADFDRAAFLEMLDVQKDLDLKRTNIKGEIFLEGKIHKDAGKLYNYPYERIFRSDELIKEERKSLIVNKLSSIRVLRFVPKLED